MRPVLPMGRSQTNLNDYTSLLIDVQTNPERDTRLETLAAEQGVSPFHFHRGFTGATGETPRRYVDRVRLERAAYRLSVTPDRVIDIAFSVGFASHETFSRAFKRRFGKTPSEWRLTSDRVWAERSATSPLLQGEGCQLSIPSFLTLKTLTLLAWRRVGPYGTFGPPRFDGGSSEWSPLLDAAARDRLAWRPMGLVISYDNPFLTPPHLQQLDACVPLSDPRQGPTSGDVRKIIFDGGLFGAIEHRGPAATLVQAYMALVDGIARSPRFQLRDGPPLEILRELPAGGDPTTSLTEVYLPVERTRSNRPGPEQGRQSTNPVQDGA